MLAWARPSRPASSPASCSSERKFERSSWPARRPCCSSGATNSMPASASGFEILDKDYVQTVRRERGFGVNPWTTHSRFLISHRLLIDESYAGPLARLARHLPAQAASSSWTKPITQPLQRPAICHRLPDHAGYSGSRAAFRTSSVPLGDAPQWPFATASRLCWRSSIRSDSAEVSRSSKRMLDDIMVRRLKEDLRADRWRFPKARNPAGRY